MPLPPTKRSIAEAIATARAAGAPETVYHEGPGVSAVDG
jgi:hypothetical protein